MDKSSDWWEPSDEEFKKIQNMSLKGAEDSFRYIYGDLFLRRTKLCVSEVPCTSTCIMQSLR